MFGQFATSFILDASQAFPPNFGSVYQYVYENNEIYVIVVENEQLQCLLCALVDRGKAVDLAHAPHTRYYTATTVVRVVFR
jgi:hypothetical protein